MDRQVTGGAASPRTIAGKSLVYYGEAMDDRLHADFGIPKAMRLILTESVLRIEAEAAQETPAPEGLRQLIENAVIPPEYEDYLLVRRADFDALAAAQEAPAPEGLRAALVDLTSAYHHERKHEGRWDRCQRPRCQNARLAMEGRGPFAPPTPAEPPRPDYAKGAKP